MAKGLTYEVDENAFTIGVYRPFFKQNLYLKREMNNRIRDFEQIFPDKSTNNLGISVTGLGSNSEFHALMTNAVAEYCVTAVNSVYLPRWRFVPVDTLSQQSDGCDSAMEQVSNINPNALSQFRELYGDADLTEDDLFYYTYGALHSQQWRETFADDLAKSAVRIAMAASLADFRAFAEAGRDLAKLHVNYESVEPYNLEEIRVVDWNTDDTSVYRVEKMSYAGRRANLDTSRIIYNAGITLAGIPAEAHEYRLGSRSALDWLIDRYRVTTHKASGIVNDPNDWAIEHGDPRYILDLVKRVTTVSVRTAEIVRGLPELPI